MFVGTDEHWEAQQVQRQVARRRAALAAAWDLVDEVVLVGAGSPVTIPGRGDLTYPFHAHLEHLYLTDRERPGGVLAFDPAEGWVEFVTPITRAERLWEGAGESEPAGTTPIDELPAWLGKREGRRVALLGASFDDAPPHDEALSDELRRRLNHLRRAKDALELERMRYAERATAAGFAALVELIEPGHSERRLQIELEAEFFRHGAGGVAFDTIVGGGPNSAVLHFPPSDRKLQAGELVLVDAGAEYRGYASDITRTYPVSGELTAKQRELHDIVRRAGDEATELCLPGTEFRDIHRRAQLVIAEGLAELGLLRGRPEGLVESEAVSVFFPHGVGHLVGLGIRDAGEALPGRERHEFPRLRVDLPLLPGYVTTIEPGIYFVPALLHDPEFREKNRHEVNWEQAEAMIGFGGIRIENNVLVTEGGHEVLTADVPLLGTHA
jgi:Xaa-Pro aminopeptidase